MSNKSISDLGLGLLWLPAGLLFIVVVVFGLFLMAHDSPSPRHLPSATYHAIEG
jgi:hypothetical protein